MDCCSTEKQPPYLQAIIEVIVCLVLTVPLFIGMFFPLNNWLAFLLASVVQFYFGWPFYRSFWKSLSKFEIGMDALIVLGTSASYLFSSVVFIFELTEHLYFETSAVIITLVLIGQLLERRAQEKTSQAVTSLMELQPKMALVKREGRFNAIPVSAIVIGDLFQVKAGEKVPIDGIVVSGNSHIDESMLTGESMPIHKHEGDRIFAGTQSQSGVLQAEATAVGDKTALATIIRLVAEAQNSRAPVENLADTISSFFVPLVLLISIVTWIIWWVLSSFSEAVINAVAVLVVACPCALGLAIPTVIVVAMGKGAKEGLLIKNAAALQKLKQLKVLILDKTGTLTEGKLKLVDKPSDPELIAIAAALENLSEHPIAQAIAREGSTKSVTDFETFRGRGVAGKIDGKLWRIGSLRWMRELGFEVKSSEMIGKTVVYLADRKEVVCSFAVKDVLRQTAKGALAELKAARLKLIMVTGDLESAAKDFAKELGIDYRAEMLPDEKAEVVKSYSAVGMVGDGINDAPALAAADVGFAMRTGSDIAMEAADITLMHNDLHSIYRAIDLSKRTFVKVKQNLFFAFIYNCLGIVLAVLGLLNPMIAGLAMAASSLCVVSNSLLLYTKKSIDYYQKS